MSEVPLYRDYLRRRTSTALGSCAKPSPRSIRLPHGRCGSLDSSSGAVICCYNVALQGYLAHQKQPPRLGPAQNPGHSPIVGSQGGAISYERGTPVLSLSSECGTKTIKIRFWPWLSG